jgi:hypothetical protein
VVGAVVDLRGLVEEAKAVRVLRLPRAAAVGRQRQPRVVGAVVIGHLVTRPANGGREQGEEADEDEGEEQLKA